VDDAVAGYVVGGIAHPPDEAWLLSLAVADRARGRGLATGLVNELIEALRDTAPSILKLTVDPTRREALAFYDRLGFREGARHEAYFGPGYPRVILTRQL
jgi:[ribosomal protein S18]-alanine N-acetyltransferase